MLFLIVIRDFQIHRISNRHLAILTMLLLLDLHRAPFLVTCTWMLITITTFSIGGIGMGDIKLALAMILTQGSMVLTREFLNLAFATLFMTVVMRLFRDRSLHGSVAFSQVLILPFLVLRLGI